MLRTAWWATSEPAPKAIPWAIVLPTPDIMPGVGVEVLGWLWVWVWVLGLPVWGGFVAWDENRGPNPEFLDP